MPYHVAAFLAVLFLSFVHFIADKTKTFKLTRQAWFLSMCGSLAIAYVFIVLLPKLAQSDMFIRAAIKGVFPYFEKHVYVMALVGFMVFLTVNKSRNFMYSKASYYLSLFSYAFLNFMVGYAIVDKNNPEVRPLFLFAIAMGLHFFSNDFALSVQHGKKYLYEKWVLIVCVCLGWIAGIFYSLSTIAIALVSGFIGGGVIVNVMKHEFTQQENSNMFSFALFAFIYTVLLLFIGG